MHSPICYSPELLKKISRDERYDRVFGCNDLVSCVEVFLLYPALLVVAVLREVLVDEDGSGRADRTFARE